jgi:hypothetical protein
MKKLLFLALIIGNLSVMADEEYVSEYSKMMKCASETASDWSFTSISDNKNLDKAKVKNCEIITQTEASIIIQDLVNDAIQNFEGKSGDTCNHNPMEAIPDLVSRMGSESVMSCETTELVIPSNDGQVFMSGNMLIGVGSDFIFVRESMKR